MEPPLRYQHFEVLTKSDGTPFVLGKGAMGITYKAFNCNLHSIVVIKAINPRYVSDSIARRRFLKEAQVMAKIRHPNVADIFHYGETGNEVFYAMEFCDGPTLEEYVRKGRPLTVTEALLLTKQAASALQALEKENLIHRDIKPANIILTEDVQETTQLKLIDFGLARAHERDLDLDPNLTQAGFVGTPNYASPEQLLEQLDLDIRSDIYSLGVTLWFMLTGSPVFKGASHVEIMFQHVDSEPPWERLPALPDAARGLLERMLKKSRDERFASAKELWDTIEDCLQEERLAEPGANPLLPPIHDEREAQPSIVGRSNYEILAEVGKVLEGRLFRARDVVSGRLVALRYLDTEVTENGALFDRIRQEVSRAQSTQHQNFQNILDLKDGDGGVQLVSEWVQGPSLVDFLKTRERFSLENLEPMLIQLAKVFDHALVNGLTRCQTEPHQIRLQFEDGAGEEPSDSAIVRAPIAE